MRLFQKILSALTKLFPGGKFRPIYPIKLPPKSKETAQVGTSAFDYDSYLKINSARLEHLDALGLPLENRTVLDIGCGVGDLSDFFVEKRCTVTCVDGREENIARLRKRCPERRTAVMNVENGDLKSLGTFDIVLCYGLLYHLENPLAAMRNLAGVCNEILLLETIIADHEEPIIRMEYEPPAFSQALHGLACRPSPSFIVMALLHFGFKYIYAPIVPPQHPQFKFAWKNNLANVQNGENMRCIFIVSTKAINNPALSLLAQADT
ncbi:MAG: class I SAM-dependent methyltransferase [Planctomycetes bacterium]|nr:class I SAM-dependent methyltransferase [Planctomycetota bacterium]